MKTLPSTLLRGVLGGLAVALLSASPAWAHALDGASPSNYRTRITGVSPATPGVEVRVVEAGNRLELSNTSDEEIIVTGYAEEPYLRIGPDGVFENRRSPATYRNRSRFPTEELPSIADPEAPPEWRRVTSATTIRWHDHRAHWMGDQPPGPVQRAPGREHVIFPVWEVQLRYGGQPMAVTGDLMWVPGPPAWPWLALAVASGLAVALLGRGRGGGVLTVAVLGVLVAFDIIRLVGLVGDSDGTFFDAAVANPQAVAAWLTAVVAAWRLLVGDLRLGLPLAAAAGVVFALNGFTDLNDLSRSQLPTTSPYWLARLAVALGLGLGVGVVIAAATTLSGPSPARAAADQPST